MARIAGDDKLKGYAQRVGRLLEEIAATQEDLKQVRHEAKEAGFDPTILVKAVKYQLKDKDKRDEVDANLDLFAYYVRILTGEETGGRPIKDKPPASEGATKH